LQADLVCEGGGVKGIGLTGAAVRLHEAGYTFPRIAGTSAGAIVGAVLAALQAAGEPLDRAGDIARSLDYSRFRDSGRIGRLLGPLGFLADTASLLVESGLYEGTYLRDWVRGVLADLGVRTFGDLRENDAGSALPPQRAYRLVVTASDLSRQRLVRLPGTTATTGWTLTRCRSPTRCGRPPRFPSSSSRCSCAHRRASRRSWTVRC
jgi:NTE family protein